MLSGQRLREIKALGSALEEGAWPRLEKLAQAYGLPKKMEWRRSLWRAATGLFPGRVATTLQAWAWLRDHGMTLDAASSKALQEHVMDKVPAADLAPLLDTLVGPGDVPHAAELLDLGALRRHDTAGLEWLHGRQVDLDPPGPKGYRFPTLQQVVEHTAGWPPATVLVEWLLDHGVRVRRLPPECEFKQASPLGTLISVLQNQDLTQPQLWDSVRQLWETLEAAGDDPAVRGSRVSPLQQLGSLPLLHQWYQALAVARERLEHAAAHDVPATTRRRLRS